MAIEVKRELAQVADNLPNIFEHTVQAVGDYFGKVVRKGDKVVFIHAPYFKYFEGEVVGFTKSRVRVRFTFNGENKLTTVDRERMIKYEE